MSQLGVSVITAETPPASTNLANTANAFFVGIADWGNSGATGVNTPVNSLSQAAAVIGGPTGATSYGAGRSSTNANLYDALDAFFREGGSTAYISRVLPASGGASATLALAPSAAITLTAQYQGVGGNSIFVAVNNQTTYVIITLTDASGNVLAISPQCSTLAAIVSWAATTGLVTAVSNGATLPSTVTATQMASGSNGTTPTITQWTTAINSFGSALGPGQILAPGQTNTSLSGIWSALLTHAQANNRVALCDETDGASVATIQSDITSAALPSNLEQYGGCWAGNRLIPGIVSGTTRSISPSGVLAGICARVDSTGNPNLPPAGQNFALNYAQQAATIVSGSTDTYSLADLGTLNSSGVNGFQSGPLVNNIPQPYGLASLCPASSDAIYWQFNHARLRMAIVTALQQASMPYVFSQADGQGADITAFNSALQAALMTFFNAGALYGAKSTDAFTVNTGPGVNPPAQLQAGTLSAQVAVRMAPGIQLIVTQMNAVSITQTLTQTANPAQNQ